MHSTNSNGSTEVDLEADDGVLKYIDKWPFLSPFKGSLKIFIYAKYIFNALFSSHFWTKNIAYAISINFSRYTS